MFTPFLISYFFTSGTNEKANKKEIYHSGRGCDSYGRGPNTSLIKVLFMLKLKNEFTVKTQQTLDVSHLCNGITCIHINGCPQSAVRLVAVAFLASATSLRSGLLIKPVHRGF